MTLASSRSQTSDSSSMVVSKLNTNKKISIENFLTDLEKKYNSLELSYGNFN